jgi:hypothetical protein
MTDIDQPAPEQTAAAAFAQRKFKAFNEFHQALILTRLAPDGRTVNIDLSQLLLMVSLTSLQLDALMLVLANSGVSVQMIEEKFVASVEQQTEAMRKPQIALAVGRGINGKPR